MAATTTEKKKETQDEFTPAILVQDHGDLIGQMRGNIQTKATVTSRGTETLREASQMLVNFELQLAEISKYDSERSNIAQRAATRVAGSLARLLRLDGIDPDIIRRFDQRDVTQSDNRLQFFRSKLEASDIKFGQEASSYKFMKPEDRGKIQQAVSEMHMLKTWVHRGFVASLHKLQRERKGSEALQKIYGEFSSVALQDNLDFGRLQQANSRVAFIKNVSMDSIMNIGGALLMQAVMTSLIVVPAGVASLPWILLGSTSIFVISALQSAYRSRDDQAMESLWESMWSPNRFRGNANATSVFARSVSNALSHPYMRKAVLDTSTQLLVMTSIATVTDTMTGLSTLVSNGFVGVVGTVLPSNATSWIQHNLLANGGSAIHHWVLTPIIMTGRTAMQMSLDPYERIRIADQLDAQAKTEHEPIIMTRAQLHKFVGSNARMLSETNNRATSLGLIFQFIRYWTRLVPLVGMTVDRRVLGPIGNVAYMPLAAIGSRYGQTAIVKLLVGADNALYAGAHYLIDPAVEFAEKTGRETMSLLIDLISNFTPIARRAFGSAVDLIYQLTMFNRATSLPGHLRGLLTVNPINFTKNAVMSLFDVTVLILMEISLKLQLIQVADQSAGDFINFLLGTLNGPYYSGMIALMGPERSLIKKTFNTLASVIGGTLRFIVQMLPAIMAFVVLLVVVAIGQQYANGMLGDTAAIRSYLTGNRAMLVMNAIDRGTATVNLNSVTDAGGTMFAGLSATQQAANILKIGHAIAFTGQVYGPAAAQMVHGLATNALIKPILMRTLMSTIHTYVTPAMAGLIGESFHSWFLGMATAGSVAYFGPAVFLDNKDNYHANRVPFYLASVTAGLAVGGLSAMAMWSIGKLGSQEQRDREIEGLRARVQAGGIHVLSGKEQDLYLKYKDHQHMATAQRLRSAVSCIENAVSWLPNQVERLRRWTIEGDDSWFYYMETVWLGQMQQFHTAVNSRAAYTRFLSTQISSAAQAVTTELVNDFSSFLPRAEENKYNLEALKLQKKAASSSLDDIKKREGNVSEADQHRDRALTAHLEHTMVLLDRRIDAFDNGKPDADNGIVLNTGFWSNVGASFGRNLAGISALSTEEIAQEKAMHSMIKGRMNDIMQKMASALDVDANGLTADQIQRRNLNLNTLIAARQMVNTAQTTESVLAQAQASLESLGPDVNVSDRIASELDFFEMMSTASLTLSAKFAPGTKLSKMVTSANTDLKRSADVLLALSTSMPDDTKIDFTQDMAQLESTISMYNDYRPAGVAALNLNSMVQNHFFNQANGVLKDGRMTVANADGLQQELKVPRSVSNIAASMMTGELGRIGQRAVDIVVELENHRDWAAKRLKTSDGSYGAAVLKFGLANENIQTILSIDQTNNSTSNAHTLTKIVQQLSPDQLLEIAKIWQKQINPTVLLNDLGMSDPNGWLDPEPTSNPSDEPSLRAAAQFRARLGELVGNDTQTGPSSNSLLGAMRGALAQGLSAKVSSMNAEQMAVWQTRFMFKMQAIRVEVGLHTLENFDEFKSWVNNRSLRFLETIQSPKTFVTSVVEGWFAADNSDPDPYDWFMVGSLIAAGQRANALILQATDAVGAVKLWNNSEGLFQDMANLGDALATTDTATFIRGIYDNLHVSIRDMLVATYKTTEDARDALTTFGFNAIKQITDIYDTLIDWRNFITGKSALDAVRSSLPDGAVNMMSVIAEYVTNVFYGVANGAITYIISPLIKLVGETIWNWAAEQAKLIAEGLAWLAKKLTIRQNIYQSVLRVEVREMERAKQTIIDLAMRDGDEKMATLLQKMAAMQTATMRDVKNQISPSNIQVMLETSAESIIQAAQAMASDMNFAQKAEIETAIDVIRQTMTDINTGLRTATDIQFAFGGDDSGAAPAVPSRPGGNMQTTRDATGFNHLIGDKMPHIENILAVANDIRSRAHKHDKRHGLFTHVNQDNVGMADELMKRSPNLRTIQTITRASDQATADTIMHDYLAQVKDSLGARDFATAEKNALTYLFKVSPIEFYYWVESNGGTLRYNDIAGYAEWKENAYNLVGGVGAHAPEMVYQVLADQLQLDESTKTSADPQLVADDRFTKLFKAQTENFSNVSAGQIAASYVPWLSYLTGDVTINQKIQLIMDYKIHELAGTAQTWWTTAAQTRSIGGFDVVGVFTESRQRHTFGNLALASVRLIGHESAERYANLLKQQAEVPEKPEDMLSHVKRVQRVIDDEFANNPMNLPVFEHTDEGNKLFDEFWSWLNDDEKAATGGVFTSLPKNMSAHSMDAFRRNLGIRTSTRPGNGLFATPILQVQDLPESVFKERLRNMSYLNPLALNFFASNANSFSHSAKLVTDTVHTQIDLANRRLWNLLPLNNIVKKYEDANTQAQTFNGMAAYYRKQSGSEKNRFLEAVGLLPSGIRQGDFSVKDIIGKDPNDYRPWVEDWHRKKSTLYNIGGLTNVPRYIRAIGLMASDENYKSNKSWLNGFGDNSGIQALQTGATETVARFAESAMRLAYETRDETSVDKFFSKVQQEILPNMSPEFQKFHKSIWPKTNKVHYHLDDVRQLMTSAELALGEKPVLGEGISNYRLIVPQINDLGKTIKPSETAFLRTMVDTAMAYKDLDQENTALEASAFWLAQRSTSSYRHQSLYLQSGINGGLGGESFHDIYQFHVPSMDDYAKAMVANVPDLVLFEAGRPKIPVVQQANLPDNIQLTQTRQAFQINSKGKGQLENVSYPYTLGVCHRDNFCEYEERKSTLSMSSDNLYFANEQSIYNQDMTSKQEELNNE